MASTANDPRYPIPTPDHPVSTWTWYIAGLSDFDAMKTEILKCPEDKREEVKKRVRHLILESNKARQG
jgi:hypothetical protein